MKHKTIEWVELKADEYVAQELSHYNNRYKEAGRKDFIAGAKAVLNEKHRDGGLPKTREEILDANGIGGGHFKYREQILQAMDEYAMAFMVGVASEEEVRLTKQLKEQVRINAQLNHLVATLRNGLGVADTQLEIIKMNHGVEAQPSQIEYIKDILSRLRFESNEERFERWRNDDALIGDNKNKKRIEVSGVTVHKYSQSPNVFIYFETPYAKEITNDKIPLIKSAIEKVLNND